MTDYTSPTRPSNLQHGDTWLNSVTGITWKYETSPVVRLYKLPAVNYALPVATDSVLGGFKVDSTSGPISVNPTTGKAIVDAYSKSQSDATVAGVNATAAADRATAAAAAAAALTAAGGAQTTANSAVTNAASALTAANAKIASATRVGNDIVLKDAAGATVNTISLGDLGVDISADNLAIDGNFVMTFTQTNGGGVKTVDLRTLKAINSSMSLTGDGDGAPIKLVGDAAAPGNLKFYGTGNDGSKGYQDVATAIAGPIATAVGAIRLPKHYIGSPTPTIPSGVVVAIGDEWNNGSILHVFTTDDGTNNYWLGT